jgi:Peptidase family M28
MGQVSMSRIVGVGVALCVAAASLSGCTVLDVARLADDGLKGRNNGTPGSALARGYLIQQLKPIARGLDSSATGDAAYTQSLPGGTNVLAVIPGTDLADRYVVVGAHYDHLGDSCSTTCTQDTIFNGATDNATGVAAALAIARAIAAQPTKPRRSVIFAFWDEEEDGLVGSRYYVQHPLVPLANTVGYVNFDIQGSNVLPSLRNTSFAVASETGGPRLQDIVRSAIAARSLDTEMLSSIFGQGRSDYVNFTGASVPTVFFTDATGPCYHTVDDEIGVVDFDKLDVQVATALAVTRALADTSDPPAFASGTPLATFDDALGANRVIERAYADLGRFSASDQAALTTIRSDANRIVSEGRAAFGSDDVNVLLSDAAQFISIITHGTCSGFLSPSAQARIDQYRKARAALTATTRR